MLKVQLRVDCRRTKEVVHEEEEGKMRVCSTKVKIPYV